MIKSLWLMVRDDPIFMRRFNGFFTIHWALHFPVVIFLYFVFPDTWQTVSILYLALVSIYANFVSHLVGWVVSSGDVKRAAEDVAGDVKQRLVEETNLQETADEEAFQEEEQ